MGTTTNNTASNSSNSNNTFPSFAPYPSANNNSNSNNNNTASAAAAAAAAAAAHSRQQSGSGLSTVSPHMAGMNMYGIYGGGGLSTMSNPSIMSTPEMGEQAGLLPPPGAPGLSAASSPHTTTAPLSHSGMVGLDGIPAAYMQQQQQQQQHQHQHQHYQQHHQHSHPHQQHQHQHQHLGSSAHAPVVPLSSGLPGMGLSGTPLLHLNNSSAHHHHQHPATHAHHQHHQHHNAHSHQQQYHPHPLSLNTSAKAMAPLPNTALPGSTSSSASSSAKPRLPVPYQPSEEASAQVVAAAAASGIETADPQALQHPTYIGHIKTAVDAILLLSACDHSVVTGKALAGTEVELADDGLPRPRRVTRRLLDGERASLIHSGSIFVWDEKEAGMRRWTDGRCWSASRVSGCFLTYRELEGKKKTPAQAALIAAQTGKPNTGGTSNTYKLDGLIKQSFSITTLTGRKLHIISYYTKRDIRENRLRKIHEDPHFRRALSASTSLFGNVNGITIPPPPAALPPASKKARSSGKGKAGAANGSMNNADYEAGVLQWAEEIDENEYQDPTSRTGTDDGNDTTDVLPGGNDNRSGDEGNGAAGGSGASGSGAKGAAAGGGSRGNGNSYGKDESQSKRKRGGGGGGDNSKNHGKGPNGTSNGYGFGNVARASASYGSAPPLPHAYDAYAARPIAGLPSSSHHQSSTYATTNPASAASRSGSGSSASGSAYSLSLNAGMLPPADGSGSSTAATSPVFSTAAGYAGQQDVGGAGGAAGPPSAAGQWWWQHGKGVPPPPPSTLGGASTARSVLQNLHRDFGEHGQAVMQGTASSGVGANPVVGAGGNRTMLPSLSLSSLNNSSLRSADGPSLGPRGLAGGGSTSGSGSNGGAGGSMFSSLPPVGSHHRSVGGTGKLSSMALSHTLSAERPPLKRRFAEALPASTSSGAPLLDGASPADGGVSSANARSLPPLRPTLGRRKRSSSSGEIELRHVTGSGGGRLPTLKSLRTRQTSPASLPGPRSAGEQGSSPHFSGGGSVDGAGVAYPSSEFRNEDDVRLPPLSGGWSHARGNGPAAAAYRSTSLNASTTSATATATARGSYLSVTESSVREDYSIRHSRSASSDDEDVEMEHRRSSSHPYERGDDAYHHQQFQRRHVHPMRSGLQEPLARSQSRAEQESAVGALLSLRSGSGSGSGSGSQSGQRSNASRDAGRSENASASGSRSESARSVGGTPSPLVSATGNEEQEEVAPVYLSLSRPGEDDAHYSRSSSSRSSRPMLAALQTPLTDGTGAGRSLSGAGALLERSDSRAEAAYGLPTPAASDAALAGPGPSLTPAPVPQAPSPARTSAPASNDSNSKTSTSPVRSLSMLSNAGSASSSSSSLQSQGQRSSDGAPPPSSSSTSGSVSTADSTPMPATPADHHAPASSGLSRKGANVGAAMDVDPQSRGSPSSRRTMGKKSGMTTATATATATTVSGSSASETASPSGNKQNKKAAAPVVAPEPAHYPVY
ncbi:Gluconate transport-inducing protein [Tilletia horrida]|nr:Gluconate transport-inducing protein [Tilletia horrida]